MIPYEWTTRRGEGVLSGWDLEGRQRRQLTALLVDLESVPYEVAFETLFFKKKGKKGTDIYYSKINGTQALRPRCSVVPALSDAEREALNRARQERDEEAIPRVSKIEPITYLERVTKKDETEKPLMAESQAMDRLSEITAQRSRRQEVIFHKPKKGSTR